MNIINITKNIKKYEFEKKEIKNLNFIQKRLEKYINECKVGSYGGVNTDILYEEFKELGYDLEKEEVCPEDDELIGLRMPNFWPINQGGSCFSIAQYYNFIQQKQKMKSENFSFWNKEVRKDFGWVGIVELFNTSNLITRLRKEKYPFFSVPYTLTECMRYLEGHESKRLEMYKDYAQVIFDWAKKQDFFNSKEWFLGKNKSWEIQENSEILLNPKLAVKKYWQEILLNKRYEYSDRELNIVSRDFSFNRNPEIVLVGEDFLELEGFASKYDPIKHNLENWFEKSKNTTTYFPVKKRDEKNNQYKNGKILSEKYPDSKIILLSYEPRLEKTFQLSKNNLKKESLEIETIFAAQAYFNEINQKQFVGGLEECLKKKE